MARQFNGQQTKDSTGSMSVLLMALLAAMLFFLPTPVLAAKERFVLDFGDTVIDGRGRAPATLLLKKTLKDQYPWVNIQNLELKRVILVAKTRRGFGRAALRVGNSWSESYQVAGTAWDFHDSDRYTFDRIHFSSPSPYGNGPWQIDLRGNFVVRKVILVVDDQSRSRSHRPSHPGRWR